MSLILFCTCLSAQTKVITVSEDEEMSVVNSLRYVSPEYVEGSVQFKDGTRYPAMLNIDIYNSSTLFISPEKDTLAVTNEKDIERVSLGSRMFFKTKNGYTEVLDMCGDVLLGCQRRLSILEIEKVGAFGMPTNSSSVQTISTLYEGGNSFELSKYKNAKFKYEEIPVIISDGKNTPISDKTLKKYFPKKKESIDSYLSENKVDMKDANQVRALFRFLMNN